MERFIYYIGYLEYSFTNLNLKDFKSDLPNQFKNIVLLNNYKIEEIILPKDVDNSMLLRVMAIRKGKMFRSLEVNENIIEKQYNIVV